MATTNYGNSIRPSFRRGVDAFFETLPRCKGVYSVSIKGLSHAWRDWCDWADRAGTSDDGFP